MAHWVVIGRVLAHTHQCCGLLNVQILRVFIKIYLAGHLDAHGIVQEVELVEVHLDDLVLGIIALEFNGDNPLDGLLQRALKDVVGFGRIQLLGKLLSDGTATTGALLAHDDALDDGAADCPDVDARVLVKTGILGGNQGLCQERRHLVKIHIDAVTAATVISSHLNAIGAVDGRGKLVGGVLQLVDGRHVTDHAVINQYKHERQQSHKNCKT